MAALSGERYDAVGTGDHTCVVPGYPTAGLFLGQRYVGVPRGDTRQVRESAKRGHVTGTRECREGTRDRVRGSAERGHVKLPSKTLLLLLSESLEDLAELGAGRAEASFEETLGTRLVADLPAWRLALPTPVAVGAHWAPLRGCTSEVPGAADAFVTAAQSGGRVASPVTALGVSHRSPHRAHGVHTCPARSVVAVVPETVRARAPSRKEPAVRAAAEGGRRHFVEGSPEPEHRAGPGGAEAVAAV